MGEVETSYYLRMRVDDKPGVLADITRILADREISIDAMIQKEPPEGEEQTDIILLTHRAVEKQRRRRDRADRGAADGARQGRAHPPGRAELMLSYVSARAARGRDAPQPFSAILLEGLAPDGGLAVPRALSALQRRASSRRCAPLGYRGTRVRDAVALHRRHPAGRPARASSTRTYTAAMFGSDEITPLADARAGPAPAARVERPDARVQGHRAAAARQPVRVRAGARAARAQHPGRDVGRHRLVGRSTRCAASAASRVFMLSPHGRMSPFQQAQMYSLQDANIHNIAIEGVFDDCQDIVKAVNADAAFKARYRDRRGQLDQLGARRGAGRLLLQGLLRRDARATASAVDFAVPSGNFGNIFAGHVARADGPADPPADPRHQRERRARRVLPHRRLPAARARARRKRRRARRWTSPRRRTSSASSFDIGRPRSAPRCARCGSSSRARRLRPARRRRTGRRSQASGFVSGRSTHADRIATIRDVDARYGVIIDPHTADGIKVGRELREPGVPLICIETALPAKFAATIREALGREPRAAGRLRGLEARPQHVHRAARRRRARQGVHRRSTRGLSVAACARCAVPLPLRSLVRNLVAGLRLAFFLPVTRLAFRIDLAAALLLFVVSCAHRRRAATGCAGADRVFVLPAPAPSSPASRCCCCRAHLALALRRARSRWRCRSSCWRRCRSAGRRTTCRYALPTSLPRWRARIAAGRQRDARVGGRRCWCARSRSMSTTPPRGAGSSRRRRRTAAGDCRWCCRRCSPTTPWFRAADAGRAPVAISTPASEPVLAAQAYLLDERSRDLEERARRNRSLFRRLRARWREGVSARTSRRAQGDGRALGHQGRSIVLVNNPRDAADTPFATVTNLRETLNEIGAAIDADEDVVMVYLAATARSGFHISRRAAAARPRRAHAGRA